MFLKYAKIDTMKTEEPISIGLCVQIMIDTIGQDCLLDYLAEPPASKDYACQRQKFERLKKRKAFDPTTIKNLEDFSDFIKDWSEWLIGDGYSSGITMNYIDRFLVQFTTAAQLQVPVGKILYVAAYAICYVIWETLLTLFEQDKNQFQGDLIRSALSIFDYFDSDSKYLNQTTIFKKVFRHLDNFITDKSKLFEDLSQWISNQDEAEASHELERQIDRWIKGEQSPSWKYVKYFCSEDFLPSKELFKRFEGLTDEENEPVELWKNFRRIFLLAYFINNFFNSLEIKQKLITKEQKEYLIDGIRYMFRVAWYSNNPAKSDMASEMNFVFYSLFYSLYKNMPEDGLKSYLEKFIPWLVQTNPAINFGITQIFEKEAEIFVEN